MQDLFITPELEFQKVAAEVKLPEDPNQWPMEILQELHKHVPFVADFDPHVVMERVDAERGYALGHVEIMNKTEIQAQDPKTLEAAGINEVRIPIVVKNGRLQPFDILITKNQKMLPLTEMRLRQSLFRPQMFDTTSKTPGDQSMVSQLYPPYRQNFGMGGGGMSVGTGMGKEGAALLSKILPTINETDYVHFSEKLAGSRDLLLTMAKNASAKDAISTLALYSPTSSEKTAGALLDAVKPTVAQLTKVAAGYKAKMASHFFWQPQEKIIDRGHAVRVFGEKVVLAADMSGSVTMTEGADVTGEPEGTEASLPQLVKDYGIYKCKTTDGKDVIGFVFPNLIDADGTPLPIALFTNGSQAAVQSEISGVLAGEGAALFEGGKPKGNGAFYRVLPNGHAEATIPFTVKGSISANGSVGFECETYDGRPCRVVVQPGIQQVTSNGEETIIPDSFRWMPLDQAQNVELVGMPEQAAKMAAANRYPDSVFIRAGGSDSFSISGMAVEKLASDSRSFLSYEDAVFLLGGLGVSPQFAGEKLAQALAFSAPVPCPVGRQIETIGEARREALEKAASFVNALPSLKKDLVKEAAVIPDPTAVDTVLSLGFVNPENVMSFIAYLPQLDESQQKLCELLLASRLGLREVPSAALERAIKATEEVIEGLKILAFQKN